MGGARSGVARIIPALFCDQNFPNVRIITLNANGIRAAARKGFFDWLPKQKADVVCIQETKAAIDQLNADFFPKGWHAFFCDANKRGYSGTAIYSREQPDSVIWGLQSPEFDNEGRGIEARFGDLCVQSLYLPSGSSKDERQQAKYRFLDEFLPRLKARAADGRKHILCGDWNIAHRNIDLKNWKSNQKNSGFLPEERAWLDTVFDDVGLVDAYRVVEPDTEQYTWWSNRGRAWDNNVGWRIDYQIVSPNLRDTVQSASVYRDGRFSDHAPLTIDYIL